MKIARILVLCLLTTAPLYAEEPSAEPKDHLLNAVRVSLWTAQALDYGTTTYALHQGAREANPVMGPIVNQPAAFAGVKLGSAFLQDWLVRKIATRNRTVALIVGAAIAGTTTAVAVHNFGVAGDRE